MLPSNAMKKSIIKISIAFIFAFACPSHSFAHQVDRLTVGGHDATNLDYIEVHQEDLVEVKKKHWEKASKFSIAVEGTIFPSTDVYKVRYSLDSGIGFLRTEGESPFYFTFVPYDGVTFPIVIRFYDEHEEPIYSRAIKIKYSAIDWFEFFKDKVETIRHAYVNKEFNEFISYIDDSEYLYFPQFMKDLEGTFKDNNKLDLSITVKSVDMSIDGALVEVSWHKTFEDDSSQSSDSCSIIFKERDEAWRIATISDESIFIVGKGTLYVIY